MLNILLIEDDAIDAENVVRIVQKLRFIKNGQEQQAHVIQASYLNRAVELLNTQSDIDLIFLDANLPDGKVDVSIATLQEINASVPIIITSGLDDKRYLENIQTSVQGYISKSDIMGESLHSTIKDALKLGSPPRK